jgi:hypothetical protein
VIPDDAPQAGKTNHRGDGDRDQCPNTSSYVRAR